METQVQEETKKCPLCEKDIEVSKFRMHEIGCARQNYRCKECKQCVPKAEREEHEEEEHAIVTCADCGFSAPKYAYGDHNESCNMKPKTCEFCSKSFAAADYEDHYNMCGNKTYQCQECQGWVKFFDRASHATDGACSANKQRKKDAEDAKQKEELERFQRERAREIEVKKKREEQQEEQERERARKQAERERQYEAMHGIDDFNEFGEMDAYENKRGAAKGPAKANAQKRPVADSERQVHPAISTSKNQGAVNKPAAIPSRNGAGNSRQVIGSQRQQPQPVIANRRMGAQQNPAIQKPTAVKAPPQQVPASQQVIKPQPRSFKTKIGNMVSKISPKNRNAKKPQQMFEPPAQQNSTNNKSSQPPKNQVNQEMALDEMNQALINQMMEEDENEILAQQLQNESYGGGGQGQNNFGEGMGGGNPMMDDGSNVRAADEQQEAECLFDVGRPQRQARHPNNQMRQALPSRQNNGPQFQNDQQLQEIERELNSYQRPNGYNNQAQHDPMMAAGGFPGGGHNDFGVGQDTEQAMLNKVIEDSLKQQQNQPSADYDEEAELNRILEASKNDL